MDQPKLTSQQENQPPAADVSDKLRATDLSAEQDESLAQVTEDKAAEAPKLKHRRIAGLRLKANAQPSPKDGLRRFALRAANRDRDSTFEAPGFVSKELPKLYASDRIHEWRGFRLERTPEAMLELERDAVPYESWERFLALVYEAIATGPDGTMCADRYLIFSKVTRHTMHAVIDPARRVGTIPKAARFTHFVPSDLLIVKIPVDCHSSAGCLDFLVKPVVGWAHSMGLAHELKLCGNTRYVARIRESAVEGVDFDEAPRHPALERIAASNPGIVDGFGSFNECDAAFRPFRARPYKFDTPSVVVESSFGSDCEAALRYKACWWLQLMAGEVKAVMLVNVDPEQQEVVVEVWRNEPSPDGSVTEEGEEMVPTRVQRLVVTKKDEFKGRQEEANPDHYMVEGGPLDMYFDDFFLEAPGQERGEGRLSQWDLRIEDKVFAREAAELWFADGELVNDWVEGLESRVE